MPPLYGKCTFMRKGKTFISRIKGISSINSVFFSVLSFKLIKINFQNKFKKTCEISHIRKVKQLESDLLFFN